MVPLSGQLEFENGKLFHEAKNVWKLGRIADGRVSRPKRTGRTRPSRVSRAQKPTSTTRTSCRDPCCSRWTQSLEYRRKTTAHPLGGTPLSAGIGLRRRRPRAEGESDGKRVRRGGWGATMGSQHGAQDSQKVLRFVAVETSLAFVGEPQGSGSPGEQRSLIKEQAI